MKKTHTLHLEMSAGRQHCYTCTHTGSKSWGNSALIRGSIHTHTHTHTHTHKDAHRHTHRHVHTHTHIHTHTHTHTPFHRNVSQSSAVRMPTLGGRTGKEPTQSGNESYCFFQLWGMCVSPEYTLTQYLSHTGVSILRPAYFYGTGIPKTAPGIVNPVNGWHLKHPGTLGLTGTQK